MTERSEATGGTPDRADHPPRHIAIVLPTLEAGGAERVHVDLASGFLARGHRVSMVLRRARGPLLDALDPAVEVHDLDVARVRGLPVPLARKLRGLAPDAVLAAMWPLTGITALASRVARVPARIVLGEHTDFRRARYISGSERRLLALAGRRVYGLADGVAAVSEGVADGLAAVARVPRERIAVVPNPIRPPGTADPDAADAELLAWWHGGEHALVAVGSLKPAKAYRDLLEAMARLRERVDARLLVIGEGPLRGELEAARGALGLDEAVRFAGFRADPAPLVRRADLFVLSSRWEGFGNVIVEALGCGVPVVATDCESGPREILDGGRHGTLAPVADPAGLAAAIEVALAAPVDREALLRRAADFAPEIAVASYLDLLVG